MLFKMMKQLRIDEGAEVRVDSVTLPSATYAKLKPQSLEFLNISNPRAVLEVELRKFACLTKNDVIAVMCVSLNVILTWILMLQRVTWRSPILCGSRQPLKFVHCRYFFTSSILIRFLNTPKNPPAPAMKSLPVANGAHFSAFSGTGQRLDGRKKPSSNSLCSDQGEELLNTLTSLPPVVCIEDYKPGQNICLAQYFHTSIRKLSFIRYDYKSRFETEREMQESKQSAGKKAVPFEGSSATIRRRY
ncbi:unnamed protein product [Strongylus vulgaris]|uniref:Ubiquitin fusion degradation protein UFD1 N-terminal subdomain 2 domain-containing protein n=1 Tax=Strongylus vulgaris TaxID=40348 RepID=A0A3P7J1Y6_STRVU|nr:unnamed protein product [Strongylus vulgaris]